MRGYECNLPSAEKPARHPNILTGGAYMKAVPILPHQVASAPLDLLYRNFQDLLKTKTDGDPDRIFLIFPESDRQFTYREFHPLTVYAAAWLDGFAPRGRTISILFRNSPEFLAIFFGATALGI